MISPICDEWHFTCVVALFKLVRHYVKLFASTFVLQPKQQQQQQQQQQQHQHQHQQQQQHLLCAR
eukprot:4710195-Amphidinium_carterae.1